MTQQWLSFYKKESPSIEAKLDALRLNMKEGC
jgi:hypothetical protein